MRFRLFSKCHLLQHVLQAGRKRLEARIEGPDRKKVSLRKRKRRKDWLAQDTPWMMEMHLWVQGLALLALGGCILAALLARVASKRVTQACARLYPMTFLEIIIFINNFNNLFVLIIIRHRSS